MMTAGRGTNMSEELTWMPAVRIRELIGKGEVSPVEVTEHFLNRIEEHDGKLKSFAFVDRKGAKAQAKRAEKAVSDGDELGLLHGIPFSVKDHLQIKGHPYYSMNVHQRFPEAPWDDIQVERMRAAGAIVFGGNTMMASGARTDLAPTDPGRMYNWDVEARNPWDTERVPGWSSSGSAAATSARLVPIAIGSDGGGSTRLPSAYSGVFGTVATPGRIPWVLPASPAIALTASTGPMCRDVVDGALALQALAGPDGRDFFSLRQEPDDYQANIDAGVEGMSFAWTDDFGYASIYAQEESPRVIATIREAAQTFTKLGAKVETTNEKWDDFWDGFNMINRVFGSGGRGMGTPPTVEEYWESVTQRKANVDAFDRVFRDHDVLLAPTTQLTARKVAEWNECWTGDGSRFAHGNFAPVYTSHVMLLNWLAMPAFSVPCGLVDGLPVGMQLIGKPGAEAKMLQIANALQKALGNPRPPAFV
jgi:Asp-tRNA(Asn)/Glu-tRNA(Gln) amidotransferase A subunit family amidase